MKKLKGIKNKPFLAASILLVLVFALMAFIFPYSGDDWAWGSVEGIERLKSWFDAYNGRYSGNLLVLLLTRVPVLKVLVMAFSYYLTCYIACKFSDSENVLSLLLGASLFLTMSKMIFTQAVVWTSGYSNYVPPILITLGYIVLIKDIFKNEKPNSSKWLFLLTFILGFIGTMFMENITIYSVFVGALVIVYCLIKFRKIYISHISYFIGTLAGCIMMFTNSSYKLIFAGENTYQSVKFDFSEMLKTIVDHSNVIYNKLFVDNRTTLIILSFLLVILSCLSIKNIEKKVFKVFALLSTAVNIAMLTLIIFKSNFSYWEIGIYSSHKKLFTIAFFSVVSALYYVSLSLTMFICFESREDKLKVSFLIISLPAIILPLFIVNPIGPRNFFPPFLIFIFMAVMMFENILIELNSKSVKQLLAAILCAVIFASATHIFSIYVPIHKCDKQRIEWATEQIETDNNIKIKKLPYDSYIHMGNPVSNKLYEDRFKRFYGFPEDVEIEWVNYK